MSEARRVEGIQARIKYIKSIGILDPGMSSEMIQGRLNELSEIPLDEFMEFSDEGINTMAKVAVFLGKAKEAVVKWEKGRK